MLVLAGLTNQAVVNLPPVVINAKPEALPGVATAIAGAITLTRLPMFAFVPLQTTLLPRLTAAVAQGDRREVRSQTLRTIALSTVLGLLGIVLLATAGPCCSPSSPKMRRACPMRPWPRSASARSSSWR